jgi:hypothetical protein
MERFVRGMEFVFTRNRGHESFFQLGTAVERFTKNMEPFCSESRAREGFFTDGSSGHGAFYQGHIMPFCSKTRT